MKRFVSVICAALSAAACLLPLSACGSNGDLAVIFGYALGSSMDQIIAGEFADTGEEDTEVPAEPFGDIAGDYILDRITQGDVTVYGDEPFGDYSAAAEIFTLRIDEDGYIDIWVPWHDFLNLRHLWGDAVRSGDSFTFTCEEVTLSGSVSGSTVTFSGDLNGKYTVLQFTMAD